MGLYFMCMYMYMHSVFVYSVCVCTVFSKECQAYRKHPVDA